MRILNPHMRAHNYNRSSLQPNALPFNINFAALCPKQKTRMELDIVKPKSCTSQKSFCRSNTIQSRQGNQLMNQVYTIELKKGESSDEESGAESLPLCSASVESSQETLEGVIKSTSFHRRSLCEKEGPFLLLRGSEGF